MNDDRLGFILLQPFVKDADGEWPETTTYVYQIGTQRDRNTFLDANGREFTKIGDGPAQGSVEIEAEDGTRSYFDVMTRVKPTY